MMNSGGPQMTALIRAFYSAVIAGLLAGLTAAQSGSSDRDSVIIGLIAGLSILGTRGIGEGVYDSRRDNAGDVKASDVSANP